MNIFSAHAVAIIASVWLAAHVSGTASAQSPADNWGHWRGPNFNGHAPSADPPVQWSEQHNLAWKVALPGDGTATPIVWDDQVFVMSSVETQAKDTSIPDPDDQPKTNFFDIKRPNRVHEFVVTSWDRETGDLRWQRTATSKVPHQGAHHDNDFASASPVTDGKRLYCWFGSAGLFAFDLNGDLAWRRNLGEAQVGSSLGEGASPALHDGRLVIVRDHAGQSSIEAFDSKDGRTLWRRERDEDNAWATPIVTEHSGATQVITAASGAIRSYDMDNGNILWQCGGLTGNVIPCPIVWNGHVICMSGYQGYAALAIPLDRRGVFDASEVSLWNIDRGTPYIPSPVLVGERLFYTQSNQAILSCLDVRTGEILFGPQRLDPIRNLYASPVAAGDRVYFVGRGGTTVVMDAAKDQRVLAVNRLNDRFDASPAISADRLFLRGEQNLYCIAAEAE